MRVRERLRHLKIPLKRVGECNACEGLFPTPRCCSESIVIEVKATSLGPQVVHFLTARGVAIIKDENLWLDVPAGLCPQLLPDKRCRIHGTRPDTCRNFPEDFSQVWGIAKNGKRVRICNYDWDLDLSREVEIDFKALHEIEVPT